VKPQNETPASHAPPAGGGSYPQSSLQLENRRFTYKELERITENFQRVLGRGGFGYVYDGFLEDGTQVAVKLRSDSSNQGVKEFLAEVGWVSSEPIIFMALDRDSRQGTFCMKCDHVLVVIAFFRPRP